MPPRSASFLSSYRWALSRLFPESKTFKSPRQYTPQAAFTAAPHSSREHEVHTLQSAVVGAVSDIGEKTQSSPRRVQHVLPKSVFEIPGKTINLIPVEDLSHRMADSLKLIRYARTRFASEIPWTST